MAQLGIRRESALKDYLLVVASLPRYGQGQRLELLKDWRRGDSAAGRRLGESFLPLVVAEAAARRGLGARFEALLSVGNRALARALNQVKEAPLTEGLEGAVRDAVVAALKAHWIASAKKKP